MDNDDPPTLKPARQKWSFWHRMPLISGLLAVLFSLGVLWFVRPRTSSLPETMEVAPLWESTRGLDPTPLEQALPDGAWLVLGGRDLNGIWNNIKETSLGHLLSSRFPQLNRVSTGGLFQFLGTNGLIGFYSGGTVTGTSALVLLLEAAPDASVDRFQKMLGRGWASWYVAKVNNVWILTQSRILAEQSAERLKSHSPMAHWLGKALENLPVNTRVFTGMDLTCFRPNHPLARELFERQRVWSWGVGGFYQDTFLWNETWIDRREDGIFKPLFLASPAPLRFAPPLGADPSLFLSFHYDPNLLRQEIRDASRSPAGAKAAALFQAAAPNLMNLYEWMAPVLSDEAGFFVGRHTAPRDLPPSVAFLRIKRPWLVKWLAAGPLRRAGWRKEGALWIYTTSSKFLSAQFAIGFRKDFVLVGTRAGVQLLTQTPSLDKPSVFSPLMAAVSPPGLVNSFFCLDPNGLWNGVRPLREVLEKKWGIVSAKQRYVGFSDLVPPLVGFSVNTRAGIYSRLLFDAHDRPLEEWDRILETFLPSGRLPPAPPPPIPLAETRIERVRGETRITIRGSSEDLPKAKNPAGKPTPTKDLLKDPDWMVREDAAKALGTLGTQQDLSALEPLLRDPSPPVRRAAQAAIKKIKSK